MSLTKPKQTKQTRKKDNKNCNKPKTTKKVRICGLERERERESTGLKEKAPAHGPTLRKVCSIHRSNQAIVQHSLQFRASHHQQLLLCSRPTWRKGVQPCVEAGIGRKDAIEAIECSIYLLWLLQLLPQTSISEISAAQTNL